MFKKKEEKDQEEVKKLWEEVGWHRPLGGVMYNYVLLIAVILPGLLVISVILPNFILPYPEAVGFYNVTLAYLEFIFFFADFGVKNACQRYISQHAEINPKHAIKYVSFFIWFQIFTGLIQITIVSIFSVVIIPQTDMAYAIWFFLIYLMIQWPGTVGMSRGGGGVFEVALNGFQQFDKANILFVLREFLFQSLTAVSFIFIGRWYGIQNPVIGELMGSTMGFILGMYVDNFIEMVVGMYFFKHTLRPFGIKLKETFYVIFDKDIVKEVLIFGGKVMPSGLSYFAVNFLITLMLTLWLWNYSTLIGLYFIATTVTDALSLSFSNGPPISEAYNNGKKELALYYIRAQLAWWGLISIGFFLIPVLVLFPSILVRLGGEFTEAAWMVYPLFLGAFILFPTGFAGSICESCDLPEHSSFGNFIEQGTRVATYFIVLNPFFGVSTWFGREWVIFFWLFSEAPAYSIKGIYVWYIVKKKLFPKQKINPPIWQMFLLPAISIIPFIPISLLMIFVFNIVFVINQIAAFGLVAIFLISSLYLVPMYIVLPMYGFLGAWDEQSLDDFRKAALISGPSRKVVTALYRKTKFGYDRSPWRGQFKIPYDLAYKEAQELTQIRRRIETRTSK